ncbi:peptidase family C50-domain-containing protein [Phakopsora pachyrhizi]|uniref:separase n=1 Tax=Phakopsora pachyrhizi TaxID=170000 RepID=A0AAV0AXQ1_PHAPC|nr:peptidase family C50-domain-containing protein [Phakopsora pachyrhizi]
MATRQPPGAPTRRSTRTRGPSTKTNDSNQQDDDLNEGNLPNGARNSLSSSNKTFKELSSKQSKNSLSKTSSTTTVNGRKKPADSLTRNKASIVEKLTSDVKKIQLGTVSKQKRQDDLPVISDPKPKENISVSEQISNAMRTVNSQLSNLSDIRKSGWKADAPSISEQMSEGNSSRSRPNDKKSTFDEVMTSINKCYTAIYKLRKLMENDKSPSKQCDIERAGLALVNYAIEFGLYNSALRLLEISHSYLQPLSSPSSFVPFTIAIPRSIDELPVSVDSWKSYSRVLQFNLPKKNEEIHPSFKDVCVLILTAMAQGFQAFLNSNTGPRLSSSRNVSTKTSLKSSSSSEDCRIAKIRAKHCLDALISPTGLCQWNKVLENDGDILKDPEISRKVLASTQASYTAVVKACALWEDLLDPSILFKLRKSLILSLFHQRIKLQQFSISDTLLEQARRSIILYARSSPSQLDRVLSETRDYFVQILQILQKHNASQDICTSKNKGWVEIVQVVLGLARKAGDLDLVEQAIPFLDFDDLSDDDHGLGSKADHDPEKQAKLLLTSLTASIGLLELFLESSKDREIEARLRKSVLTLVSLDHLFPLISIDACHRIIIVVDKFRRACSQVIKRVKNILEKEQDKSECISAACLSALETIGSSWTRRIFKKSDSAIGPTLEGPVLSLMISGSIENSITISEHFFNTKDPNSYAESLKHLELCESLIKSLREPDVSAVRCLTSTYYNYGVALYHADKLDAATDFVRPSCEFPSIMLGFIRTPDQEVIWKNYNNDEDEEVAALQKQLLKRWELLALCYLSTDRLKSYQAYVSAIASHSSSHFDHVEKLINHGTDVLSQPSCSLSLCKLVSRATRLATSESTIAFANSDLARRLSDSNFSVSNLGVAAELQLKYLYENTRKPECRVLIRSILEDCLVWYSPEKYPLRRSKSISRLMQWHVTMDQSLSAEEKLQTLQQLLNQVKSLSQSEDYALDSHLRMYSNQYLALAQVWLALGAQLCSSESKFLSTSELAISNLEGILSSLSSVLTCDSNQASPISKSHLTRQASKSKKPTRSRPLPTKASTLTAQPMTSPNKTPPRIKPIITRKLETVNVSSIEKSPKLKDSRESPKKLDFSKPCLIDDLENHIQNLKLFAHVLGARGLVFYKFRVLQYLRIILSNRLSRNYSEPKRTKLQMTVTLDLALTFLQVDGWDRSSALASEVDQAIKSAHVLSNVEILEFQALCLLVTSRCMSETSQAEEASRLLRLAGERWMQAKEEEELNLSSSELSTTQKIVRRTKILNMISLGFITDSHIKEKQGDLHLAIDSSISAVRLLHRASSNLLRVTNSVITRDRSPSEAITDVFKTEEKVQDCVPLAEVAREVKPHPYGLESHPIGHLSWQIAGLISDSLRRTTSLYIKRGSPRIAESYLSQFLAMAEQIGSGVLKANGMATKAGILILKNEFETAQNTLQDAVSELGDGLSLELMEIWQLRSEVAYKLKNYEEARSNCTRIIEILKQIEKTQFSCVLLSTRLNSPRSLKDRESTLRRSTTDSKMLPFIIARVNRIKVLVSRATKNLEELSESAAELAQLPKTAKEQVFEPNLLATLELDSVLQNFRVDPLLGVLPEAMIVIPKQLAELENRGIDNQREFFPSLSKMIDSIEGFLTRGIIGSASVPHLYETIHTLITLKFISCILHRVVKNTASEVAALLDFAGSLTIRREFFESVHFRLQNSNSVNSLSWPVDTDPSSDILKLRDLKIDSDECLTSSSFQTITTHHLSDVRRPSEYRPVKNLPSSWRIVSIHLALDKDSLYIVNHSESEKPLVVKLPLDRLNRREGEDNFFTLSTAVEELKSIVTKSNAATQRARHVSGHNEKVSWWKERKELDTRMEQLVENIENNWLGACKGILRPCNKTDDLVGLRESLEKLFRRHLISPNDKNFYYSKNLDGQIIESFISLPISCRDEDLEDFIQFAVDTYQIQEAPVVGDEVDADQVVCELRDIQKAYLKPFSKRDCADQHLFLILDKAFQGFPWEVLPILRGHSVSRIPSLSFLRDRLDVNFSSSLPMVVDSRKTSYILNPSGDLKNTQTQFESWLDGNLTWSGIKGRYFGHGGAEQYIRSTTIKQLPRCATTMLWGCSSGMLLDQGDFEPTGTPYAYMLGGCPSLLANLWDVTDKDIDKLAVDLFKRIGLFPNDQDKPSGGTEDKELLTITSALAQARSVCQLKYLNGAAPVVYGMPVKFAPCDK